MSPTSIMSIIKSRAGNVTETESRPEDSSICVAGSSRAGNRETANTANKV